MRFSPRIIYHLPEDSGFSPEDRMRFYQRINVYKWQWYLTFGRKKQVIEVLGKKIFIQDKMTRRVNIVEGIWENCKKVIFTGHPKKHKFEN